jgi:predicted metal-dependent hydrolase
MTDAPKERLLVRRPFDRFGDVDPQWLPRSRELCHYLNVASIMMPHLERYLNRTMRASAAMLPPEREELRRYVGWFCQQEGEHYRLHQGLNDALQRGGYPLYDKIDALFKNHFEQIEKRESLAFNLAYSVGFETVGMTSGYLMFVKAKELFEGAHPEPLGLWRWHLAEEYEHRSVAFDLFRAIHGSGPRAYKLRTHGLLRFCYDLNSLVTNTALKAAIDEDRASSTPTSRARFKAFRKAERRVTGGTILQALSPYFNPSKCGSAQHALDHLKQVRVVAER